MNNEGTLHIGVAPRDVIKKRTIAIARGEISPEPSEPRVWFSSVESLAKVLSEKNMLLLEIIRRGRPQSFAELSKLSGREVSNLSRTLHNMERFGLIAITEENHRKVPHVRYERVTFEVALGGDEPAHAA